jgi:ABC-type nitrate/sulfonate/bicarbonate transport system permease component
MTDAVEAVAVGPVGPAVGAGSLAEDRDPGDGRVRLWRAVGSFGSFVLSVAIGLGAWQLFLVAFDVDSFIGKDPLDVWHHLWSEPDSAASRSELWDASRTTLRDAFIGLALGSVAAVVVAVAFTLWRGVEQTLMPIAMVLRSVPLVAMTPLIVVIFGRDLLAVTVITGIVTFFATLVNVSLALRSTPSEAIDLCHAYGASPFQTLRKVQLPVALPALFASLRIAAPLALVGALLAEGLATGDGLGWLMAESRVSFQIEQLWAAVFLVTAYSVALYTLIGTAERAILTRYAPSQPQR